MSGLRYIDVCSGISAPTMAWKPLGWRALCFAEIEAAPRSVLAHHYPDVPLRGDFTEIEGTEYGPVDLLVGGTPCQSFSIAGLRGGLGDDRGNLALEFARLADRARPRWVVWENVPGVLSSNGGRDFGSILGALAELGYGVAYRVLDAQHFGVPQRRRRVFVVGYLGDWRCAAAVLFERHGLSGYSAPRREAGKGLAGIVARSVAIRGRDGTPQAELGDEVANAILTPNGGRAGVGCGAVLCEPIAIQERAVSENPASGPEGAGFRTDGQAYTLEARTVPQAIAFNWQAGGKQTSLGYDDSGLIGTLAAYQSPAIAIPINPNAMRGDSHAQTPSIDAAGKLRLRDPGLGVGNDGDPADTLQAAGPGAVATASAVRRLTPRECERLQGFSDDFTLVPHRGKPMADGPRYKALGNSMAVPVLRWIGERIEMVEQLQARSLAA